MPAFGRLSAVDARDWPLTRAAGLYLPERLPFYKYWTRGPVLDQNGYPQCVAYAWKGWLLASPLRQGSGVSEADVYHEAQVLDEWPGESYDGTSVRAGAKALTGRGFVASYLFSTAWAEVRDWILGHGPVVLGTTWHNDMMQPGSLGYVTPTGGVAGGHAYNAIGYSTSRKSFRCLNSWGSGWGQFGKFWLRQEDLQTLLDDEGEACTAVEQSLPA